MNSNIKMQVLKNIIIPEKNSGNGSILKIDCPDGLGLMTTYHIFPGIQLIYNDFETTEFRWENSVSGNIMEINHCRNGREGSELNDGSCLYLGEGDLSIHMMENCAPVMSFPLKHYRGISVVMDLDIVNKNPPESLKDTDIDFLGFKEKFCGNDSCFVMPAKDEIEHIFSELYCIPEGIQRPYFKLKIQELLLFLYMIDIQKENQRAKYMSPQVEIVKNIHKRLTTNLRERITIDDISKEYLINSSTLKETFKGIYGKPIATYMKEYRIKEAAILLRQTSSTVSDISLQVGYINQSKFASAFREIMKISPSEYRNQYSETQ